MKEVLIITCSENASQARTTLKNALQYIDTTLKHHATPDHYNELEQHIPTNRTTTLTTNTDPPTKYTVITQIATTDQPGDFEETVRNKFQHHTTSDTDTHIDHVLIPQLGVLNQTLLMRFLKTNNTDTHPSFTILDFGITITPDGDTTKQERFFEAIKDARRKLGVWHKTGAPPLGTTVQDGILVKNDNYNHVTTILQEVDTGDMSKRAAADELDCTRKTISNALDRRQLYNLNTRKNTAKR